MTYEFSLERNTFSQMVLVVNYLKERYGNDLIKKLLVWYVENDRGPLLMTTLLKAEYDDKTTMDDLNQDFLNWKRDKS